MVWVAGFVTAWLGKAGEVRLVTARAVQVRHGRQGTARHDMALLGSVRHGNPALSLRGWGGIFLLGIVTELG
jgi:hypothetical protein